MNFIFSLSLCRLVLTCLFADWGFKGVLGHTIKSIDYIESFNHILLTFWHTPPPLLFRLLLVLMYIFIFFFSFFLYVFFKQGYELLQNVVPSCQPTDPIISTRITRATTLEQSKFLFTVQNSDINALSHTHTHIHTYIP